tara:strand:- start:252 stop:2282 length:2031 start_codon:yes stop_codon:yes gene_type:complete
MAEHTPDPEQTKESTDALKEQNDALAQTQEQLERNKKAILELDNITTKLVETQQNLTDRQKEQNQAVRDAEIAYQEARVQLVKLKQEDKDTTAATEELTKAFKELQGARGVQGASQAFEQLGNSLGNTVGNFAQATLGINTSNNSISNLIGSLGDVGVNAGSMSDIFKTSMGSMLNKANVFAKGAEVAFGVAEGIFKKFTEATLMAQKTTEDLSVSLIRDLGVATNQKQVQGLLALAQSSGDANVTFGKLSEAAAKLSEATAGVFGNVLQTRKEMIMFTGEMTGLGVSTDSTAEMFGNFGKIIQGGGEFRIKEATKAAVNLARQFGVSSDSMVKKLAGLSESLAQFGDNSLAIGTNVLRIASNLKISEQSIVKFGESFEYFPDALQKANDLNLVFGRSVVSGRQLFQMMNDGTMGPGEAFSSLLRNIAPEIDAAFAKSPSKVRAFANAMGISRTEAQRLANEISVAGGNMDQVLNKNIETLKERNRVQATYSSLQEKIVKFQEKFARSIEPLANVLGQMLDYLNEMPIGTLQTLATVLGIAATAIAGALAGAAIGALGGPIGMGIGFLTGLGGGIIGAGAVAAFSDTPSVNDAIVQDGKVTPFNPDDRAILAKPNGPIAQALEMPVATGGAAAAGPDSLELKVDLFGERLVDKMVSLVADGLDNRKALNDIVAGRV